MITKTVLPFKLETTHDTITPHAGLALFGEFAHGLGLPELVDSHMPLPGSGAGYRPSQFVMPLL
ncbi:MAG: IS1380 family transposase, partial [bacterium]|nr:IS1380 family transposase [bacterium]